MSRWAGTGGTVGVWVGCRVGGVWEGQSLLTRSLPSTCSAQQHSVLQTESAGGRGSSEEAEPIVHTL